MALFDEVLSERVRFTPSEVVSKASPVTASDSLRLFPELIPIYGAVMREVLRLRPVMTPQMTSNVAVSDVVRLADLLQRAHDITLTDGVGIEFEQQLQRAASLVDELELSDALQANAVYQLTITQAVRLTARLLRFFGADVTDGLALEESVLARALVIAGIAEEIGIEPVVAPQLIVRATAADTIALEPADVVGMLFQPTMREGIEFSIAYIAPDGSFTTWAMNTRTGAVTEYDDFVFNSFARVGNRYIGASSDGLYELIGDDDDGEQIIARMRSGYLQFGGTQLSRLKAAYIAARGEGEMFLKIIEGGGREYVYRTDTRDMRSTKVHMGKGQKSRYFAFELVTAGQDFDLDTIEFVPIVVPRRV